MTATRNSMAESDDAFVEAVAMMLAGLTLAAAILILVFL